MSVDPKWFKEELWRLIDAAQILNGVEPLRGARDADDPNCVYELIPDLEVRADVWDVYNQAKYSRHNGTLKHRGSPTGREGNYLIPVLDFLDWAESKGYSLEHIPQGVFHVADEYGKYPPAEPGALDCEPLKAALWGR